MESKDELKKTGIKNRTCYYFDNTMRVIDHFSDILLKRKLYKTCKNILIYDISHKTFMGLKALRIRFDELYRCKIYDGIRYLTLFGSGL